MRNKPNVLPNNWRRLLLALLLVPSVLIVSAPREGNSAATTAAQPRKGVVVFAVSAESGEGSMDAVVIVDGKLLRTPYSDEQKDKQKSFANEYFAPGKVYRLIFGGGEAGNVTVKKWSEGCNNIHAEVTPATTARLGGKVMALATSSESLGKRASARRAPTDAERAQVMALMKSIYAQHRTPASLIPSIKVTNLTATDLNGDGKYEMIASFTLAAKNKFERDLFLIAHQQQGVRFTSPNTVVQLRLEVYDEAGQKLLDTEQRGGNVLDWHLQGGAGERVADGVYLCVLTIKNLSGRLSQKLGRVTVSGQATVVRAAAVAELGLRQAQSVGPVEIGEAGLTVMGAEDLPPVTVLAHNGNQAQLARTRGALTFRVGNFFSGDDKEQMRLTEDGSLGIGTKKPQAKLDVAGTIRAERVLIAKPKTPTVDKTVDKTAADDNTQAADSGNSVQPLASGTGTQNHIAKWTDGAGTLGDSTIFEDGSSNIGIGTTAPSAKLSVSANTGIPPAAPLGVITYFVNADENNTFMTADSYGNGPVHSDFLFRHARGTMAAPLAVQADDIIGQIQARGYGSSGFATNARSGIRLLAAENWTDANQGAYLAFMTTPKLSATINVERMRITDAGDVGIGTTGPGAKLSVVGNINTSTQYDIRGNRALSVTGAGSFLNSNTFAGAGAGASNTPSGTTANGNNNSFFGLNAGGANTNGFGNSLFGRQAGFANTLGFGNSFFGDLAGNATQGGDNNSFFGRSVGLTNISGNENSLFGAFADSADGLTNATAIGFRAFVAQSNSLVLGGVTGVNSGTDTKVGIGTTTPAKHLHIFGAGDQEIAIESSDNGGRQWTLQSSKGTSGGRFEIVDRTAGVSRLTIINGGDVQSDGGVGIGTTAPATRLNVVGLGAAQMPPFLGSAPPPAPGDNVALIEATSNNGSAVLGLKNDSGNPNSSDNFITFYKFDNSSAGAIEGNGFGGVSFVGAGNDYAEWLPRLNAAEKIQPGEIVGLYGGHITKNTRGAAQVMAVSTGSIVAGNDPGKEARGKYALVAFIGQVMTRVRGSVQVGDFIVASGLNDGTGVAVSPERITSEQFEQVAGQAWETSTNTGVKSVRVAVGLIRRDPTVRRLLEYSRYQADRIGALDARLTTIEAQLTSKTARTSPLPVTRKKHRLVARLAEGTPRSVRTAAGTIR